MSTVRLRACSPVASSSTRARSANASIPKSGKSSYAARRLFRASIRPYGLDHLPTDEELLQLAERWRPYRSLAVSYLFASEYDGPASAQA